MTVAIIDGPFLTFRAWAANDGDKDSMFGATLKVVMRYLTDGFAVWVVWEQPGRRGLDFRRKIDPGYKARRSEKPEGYIDLIGELSRGLSWLGVNQAWPKEGEADDAAATLCRENIGRGVELWTADHDWLQLVQPGVVCRQAGRNARTVTVANIAELTGGDASWNLNLMSLCGDAGDDIPGLPRIGKQRAADLLAARPTIVQDVLDCDGDVDHVAIERAVAAKSPGLLRWAQVVIDNPTLLRNTRDLVTLRTVELMRVPASPRLDTATEWLVGHNMQRHVEPLRELLDPDPWTVDDKADEREPWEDDGHQASDPPAEPWQ